MSSDFWTQAGFVAGAASACNKLLSSGPLEPRTEARLQVQQVRSFYASAAKRGGAAHSEPALDTHQVRPPGAASSAAAPPPPAPPLLPPPHPQTPGPAAAQAGPRRAAARAALPGGDAAAGAAL
jgi:hypothetical protein